MKRIMIFALLAVIIMSVGMTVAQDDVVVAEPGLELDMVFLPKFTGIAVFDQAHAGAREAHEELGNTGTLEYVGPAPTDGADAQIPFITSAVTQGVDAIMISNNGGLAVEPATISALEAGIPVVSWDSPVSPAGESLFIAQVDFTETGQVMADMALGLLPDGGSVGILSAGPDSTNQNIWIDAMMTVIAENPDVYGGIEIVTVVYGNDVSEDSYNEALGLIDQGIDLIMAPTTVGIAAAARAVQDEGLCGEVLVSGLGLPQEMQGFVEAGCAQDFALWNFDDLGYLTYYVAYLLASGAMEAEAGVTFEAGRMGTYTIEATPDGGLRVLMGPFSVYTPDNFDEWAVTDDAGDMEVVVAEPGLELDMVFLPKFTGIAVFDQAHAGAREAHEELGNTGTLEYVGPAPTDGADAQIPFITSAVTQGVDAIMISNNGGLAVEPATISALEAGIPVVSWDSPVSPAGESLFIAQVDFTETGQVMADMALGLLPDGGSVGILSAGPDSTNQNIWIDAMMTVIAENPDVYGGIEIVTVVYGNDVSEDSYNEALGLIDQGIDLIMAPTTVGIAAAARAVQDEGLCGEVLVSGLGLPQEMQGFVEAGCAQDFALWNFDDLGYLTYYVAYLLASGAMEAEAGVTFEAGRMGTYTIEATPDGGLRVLMGPFSVYTPDNFDEWATSE